jgi:hypothetical protein
LYENLLKSSFFKASIEAQNDEILTRYFGKVVRGHRSLISDPRHPKFTKSHHPNKKIFPSLPAIHNEQAIKLMVEE